MKPIAGALLAALVLLASGALARAEVLTTPGYSERDTPADLPSAGRDRNLDIMVDVQAQTSNASNGQAGGSGQSGTGGRQQPGRLRYRLH
jgi:hypothetical protein